MMTNKEHIEMTKESNAVEAIFADASAVLNAYRVCKDAETKEELFRIGTRLYDKYIKAHEARQSNVSIRRGRNHVQLNRI